MHQTIYITQPAYLRLHNGQMLVCLTKSGEVTNITLPDCGYVLLDHPQITISQGLLRAMGEANVALIVCNEKHHPISIKYPLYGHHLSHQRFKTQIEASLPLKKKLWKIVIKQKLKAQGDLLAHFGYQGSSYLYDLSKKVLTGDKSNREAIGARFYWKNLFPINFKRDPHSEGKINASLNYGYAILRASVTRSLVGSGLLPILGIHHSNKYNPYCLSDDIMEPYRPFIDQLVVMKKMKESDTTSLSIDERKYLLQLLEMHCQIKMGLSTLQQAIESTCKSLALAFEEKEPAHLFYASIYANHGRQI